MINVILMSINSFKPKSNNPIVYDHQILFLKPFSWVRGAQPLAVFPVPKKEEAPLDPKVAKLKLPDGFKLSII